MDADERGRGMGRRERGGEREMRRHRLANDVKHTNLQAWATAVAEQVRVADSALLRHAEAIEQGGKKRGVCIRETRRAGLAGDAGGQGCEQGGGPSFDWICLPPGGQAPDTFQKRPGTHRDW